MTNKPKPGFYIGKADSEEFPRVFFDEMDVGNYLRSRNTDRRVWRVDSFELTEVEFVQPIDGYVRPKLINHAEDDDIVKYGDSA